MKGSQKIPVLAYITEAAYRNSIYVTFVSWKCLFAHSLSNIP